MNIQEDRGRFAGAFGYEIPTFTQAVFRCNCPGAGQAIAGMIPECGLRKVITDHGLATWRRSSTDDGALWRSNLSNPVQFPNNPRPERPGFFTFGIAWGRETRVSGQGDRANRSPQKAGKAWSITSRHWRGGGGWGEKPTGLCAGRGRRSWTRLVGRLEPYGAAPSLLAGSEIAKAAP